MTINDAVLKYDERMVYDLRELYRKHGYTRFKMGKFEEYDLYSKNKDFRVSDSVITFTDTNGKLMALKPDVTLSIVKNAKWQSGCVQKVYYNENVYRVSRSTHAFEELMQAGLECIGDLDATQLSEVTLLAARSLQQVSDRFVLDISHMGILSAMMETIALSADAQDSLLQAVSEKTYLLAEPDIEAALEQAATLPDIKLLILDSIQAVFAPEIESAPGSVSQVRACAAASLPPVI